MCTNPSLRVGIGPEQSITERLEVALSAARAAGAAALELFQTPAMTFIQKPDDSPVTPADKECETLIRARITAAFPRDTITGEEFGTSVGDSAYTWIIDPIDGTRSFIKGIPTWACLVGVERRDPGRASRVVAGAAIFPALREELWACDGGGAWWKHAGERVDAAHVSTEQVLSRAIVESVHVRSFRTSTVRSRPDIDLARVFEALSQTTQRMRTWNDAFSFALLATGRIDAALGYKVNAWDLAPFAVILREAGGVLEDWRGEETIHAGHFAAGNPALCAALRTVLAHSATP